MFIKYLSILLVSFFTIILASFSTSAKLGVVGATSTNKDLIVEGLFTIEVIGGMEEHESWGKKTNYSCKNNSCDIKDPNKETYYNESEHISLSVSLTSGNSWNTNEYTGSFIFAIGVLDYYEEGLASSWIEYQKKYKNTSEYGQRYSIGIGHRYYDNEMNFSIRAMGGIFTKYDNGVGIDAFIEYIPNKSTVFLGIIASFQGGEITRSDGPFL